jgi:hypothetical protein
LVPSVDADKSAARSQTSTTPRRSNEPASHDIQQNTKQRVKSGWTQPKSLQDSLGTLRWVKPKQAQMAEIHRPRPSFLRASVKASPIKAAVPDVAETGGLIRLATAQVPTPAEEEDASEVFDVEPFDLDELLGDDDGDDGFPLPGAPGDDELPGAAEGNDLPADDLPADDLPADGLPADDPPTDDSELQPIEPVAQPLDSAEDGAVEPEPATNQPLPNVDNGGLPGDLPTPDNGTTFPDVEPTPLGQPGDSIELEPLTDELASMFNGRDCPAEEKIFLEAWEELRRRPISSISLDITPSITPTQPENAAAAQAENMAAAPSRVWRDRRGRVLAEGRMVNYRNAQIRVETESGSEDLSWYALSNEDLCFVSSWWELPSEFSAATNEYVPRDWTLTTFTWTASALSHKPLYFEEVQLERYGHSAGPIKQPILSGVHFFGNIFFLPYQMGLTPPTECQYVLGYYRPGSCAPWLLPAVPLSARGARWQLAAVIGALAIFP